MSDIEIEIDGKKILTQANKMVIQVADAEGIYIPRFCYHKHLSIAANCRMCLVEVEKSPKTLPACATPVMPGMKVFTRSPKALAAQRSVMEFLLINHPLDCPICDQGGECELQDLSMGYGKADSYYVEGKRSIADEDLGPLIATEMTRCIQCTRCVRFGEEVAGMRELGIVNRGEGNEIRTYLERALHSEVSGNIIDLCPVGALTSKPFRFTARAWELSQHASIAPHDCLGSNINVHTRYGKVMRVVPRENSRTHLTWLSDRDRYSYEGLYHPDRLTKPLIKKNDKWQETDWHTALTAAAQGIERVIGKFGPAQLGALASPTSTLEECYLLQKCFRFLGSSNVDHRLRQVDFSDENMPLSFNADIENADVIVLIGSNIQKEQPVMALRVRKASLNGAHIININMMDYDFNFRIDAKRIAPPHHFVHALADLDETILTRLQSGKKICILVGALALNHPQSSAICGIARKLAQQCQASLGILTEGANAMGAWLAGMIPDRKEGGEKVQSGLNAQTMLRESLKAYLLLNVEPEFDCANPTMALQALEQAECVIALSSFKNAAIQELAHVILPISPFTETSGTFVNVAGDWQTFKGVAKAWGESRPAWKVLRVLANLLHCDGFDYASSEDIRDELKEKINHMPSVQATSYQIDIEKFKSKVTLTRIGEVPLYAGDSLVRRAKALQAAQSIIENPLVAARLNKEMANQFSVKAGDWISVKQANQRIRLQLALDERVPSGAIWIPGALSATSPLTELFGEIEIEKVK